METQSKNTGMASNGYALEAPSINGIDYLLKYFSKEDIAAALDRMHEFKSLFQHSNLSSLADLVTRLSMQPGKKSFLVFKNNKYLNVLTENIAFFYVKYEAPMIMCFNREEYFVDYSLEQIQQLLPEKQFFRLNRQYLINFNTVKEVEHYFARKLLVNPIIPIKDKLLVSREKVSGFLHWLDDR
jgi:DNA-binding LytR/AlgR family response regulator